MNDDDFRSIALSLPDACESAHMGHPDFRVRGKTYATIWPDASWEMVKLTPEQQAIFVQAEPTVFVPVKGGWGRKGATNVRLESATPATVRSALVTASIIHDRLLFLIVCDHDVRIPPRGTIIEGWLYSISLSFKAFKGCLTSFAT
jgi:hypothetical protein